MSRTFRRKHADHERRWQVGRLEDIDRWDMERYGVTNPEVCLARKAARFHQDNDRGEHTPPSWYCRVRNRRLARSNDQELRRCLRIGDWDGHIPPPFVRDAGWIWF